MSRASTGVASPAAVPTGRPLFWVDATMHNVMMVPLRCVLGRSNLRGSGAQIESAMPNDSLLDGDEEEGEDCPAMQPTAQVLTVGPCARTFLALRVSWVLTARYID